MAHRFSGLCSLAWIVAQHQLFGRCLWGVLLGVGFGVCLLVELCLLLLPAGFFALAARLEQKMMFELRFLNSVVAFKLFFSTIREAQNFTF